MLRLAALLATTLVVVAAAAPSAGAAPPPPFGLTCVPRDGVRFCPAVTDDQRVPSWDGVPLDVDVTLPATGDGPFPTIVMLHGLGGSKTDFEGEGVKNRTNYNNVFYARRGYAVVNPSARGYGRSCGPDVPHTGACARGWTHLADHRYEVRDVQHLLGLLVDQGVARRDALGVTGLSYGGGQAQSLARLRDRIRLPDGSFAPWRSPAGTPLAIRAAFSIIGWSDLAYSLVPNGRFRDDDPVATGESRRPPGLLKQTYVDGLYAINAARAFLSPPGTDPTADLTRWRELLLAGEPYGEDARRIAVETTAFHSAHGAGPRSAPLLLQTGWTDDLFPAPESLRAYRTLSRRGADRYVALQFGDVGHARAGNKPGTRAVLNGRAARFFDAFLKGEGRPPRDGGVTAMTLTCPNEARARGPYVARSWEALHPGTFRLTRGARQRVTSTGGNPETARAFDRNLSEDPCTTVPREVAPGTAIARRRVRDTFTMLGLPTVRARVRTSGAYGQLAARLWDVHRGQQRLITRGVYRLRPDQRGRVTFQLFGNGWRFRRGHEIKLELLGRDPNFVRPSNGTFTVSVDDLEVELPTRERRP